MVGNLIRARERRDVTEDATCDIKAPPKGVRGGQREALNKGINPHKISALTIIGDKVKGKDGKELGKIEEVVFDLTCGTISYLVMSTGGFAGIGDKLFAISLDALTLDTEERTFYLDTDKQTLKKTHGFDKFNWPEKADALFVSK